MKKLFWLYVICLILSSAVFTSLASFPIGYESYTDWDKLPQLRLGAKSSLASSYDRSGGNSDYSHYEWPEGLIEDVCDVIVKTIDGPGVVYRFWMPHVMARRHFVVKMYFDGEQLPTIDTDSTEIMEGNFNYFDEPFITTCAGGQTCYEPIAFEDSLRIESVNKDLSIAWSNRHYYQYSYLTYPECIDVNSWTQTLAPEDQNDRNAAASIFENSGQCPDGNSPTAIEVDTPATIVDSNLVLADVNGPGVIRQLRIIMPDANDAELQGLNLQVFYDNKSSPDINIPVAYFFGAGELRADYNSIPIGAEANEGFYCYWPMPFKESVLIRLYNTTTLPIDINSAQIEYEPQSLDHHTCYLHAVENTTVKSGDIYHTILSTTGQGHYVGDLLYVVQAQDSNSFYMLEGDDVIYSDGELIQYGTGLEDTYNGGAYYNWVAIQNDEPEGPKPHSATRPLSGILYVNKGNTSRADQYRWRIADCIPFTESIEVNVECRYAYNGSRWRSVGFWYELPHLLADLNEDGTVDFEDFARFTLRWQDSNCNDCDFADLTGDRKVNANDLARFAEQWLLRM